MGNTNNKPDEDLGGSKTSGLANFLEDPICVRLCHEFQDGKISSKELHERLLEKGKKISMSTLKNYLKKINEATSQIGPFAHTKGHVLEWETSFTKFGKEKSIVMGTTGRNDWRRFRCDKSDVKNNVEYFRCNSCDARAIIRNGELQKSYLIRHNLNCLGQPRAIFIAKDIDREARKQLREGWHEKPKSIWREAYEIAQKIDVENDIDERDANSVSRNFPNWNKVRPGYNKSRQQGIGDCDDPYNLPETLKVTNFGSIRLKMDKIVTDEHRFLRFCNKEMGIILFSTELQLKAITKCSVLVCDATFDVAPKGFTQLYTIHGLFSRESSTNIGEWIVLAWSLMEKRKTENYTKVLQILLEEWMKRGEINIKRIHCDYEKAENAAVKNVFGEDFLYGCLFHFVKAALLHLRKETPNIFKLYISQKKVKGDFWKWVRRILALPLLPRKCIEEIWPELKKIPFELNRIQYEECLNFILYMEKEWLNKSGHLWDFNRIGRVRSINAAESYHSALKKDPQAIMHAKPINFIRWLQTMANEVDLRILSLNDDKTDYKARNNKYVKMDWKIGKILEDYENWCYEYTADSNQEMSFDQFVYATQYVLSILSYQLCEINELGIPLREARKKKKIVEKKITKKIDHDYSQIIKINVDELDLDCPKKRKDLGIISPSAIDIMPLKNNWAAIIISSHYENCRKYLWSAIQNGKGKLEMPESLQHFSNNCTDKELELAFEKFVNDERMFVVVFCDDDRYKTKIMECAEKNKKQLIYQACAYLTPSDVKDPEQLLNKLIELLDGIGEISSESDDEDDNNDKGFEILKERTLHEEGYEIFSGGRRIQELFFNPPDLGFIRDICYRWNYQQGTFITCANKRFNSTATPIRTDFILGDGNCGFRSLSLILTGTQDNHARIRKDIQEFLRNEKKMFEEGRMECGWWQAYYDKAEDLDRRIMEKMNPAKDASEVEKWASNVDIIAASLLYNMNFIHCKLKSKAEQEIDGFPYGWEVYCPEKSNDKRLCGVHTKDRPTGIIVYINNNHFEVVTDVKE